jgi:hypothetical protein
MLVIDVDSSKMWPLSVLMQDSSAHQAALLILQHFTANKHLFRRQIAMGSVLKNQHSKDGYLSGRAIRPLVRPYGQLVEAPLAGDGDRPDAFLLLTPSTSFWSKAELMYVTIVGCLHATDMNGLLQEEDDKFLAIPYTTSLTLADAYALLAEMRIVCTYLRSYKSYCDEAGTYHCPLKVHGFSFRKI